MKTNFPGDIPTLHKGLAEKEFSAAEITAHFLQVIDEKNPRIHAYLTVFADEARAAARALDAQIAAGEELDILAGVPLALKDNILVKGFPATAASKILENYQAAYDATVTEKLRAAGAVILGKTNMDEFAMGSSTENSAFGPTRNPVDESKVPGGSSGGSAAAVAMDGALVALGSDTGGSIRQPASFCGVVGMKPTYSTVSRYGLIAMASSLDQIGPFARTVGDARILFSAIAGKDPHDATTSSYAFDWQTPPLDNLKGVTIGLPKEYFLEGLNAEVKDAILRQVHEMERAGAVVQEVSLPHTEYALAIYYLVMAAEVSSNLARLDGIRYGYETRHKAENLEELYALNRGEGFGRETRRRIILGTYVLSAGYFDAYYVQASKARTLLKNDFARAFDTVDLLVTPTTPTTAFGFGEKTADPLVMYLSDIYTVSAPLAGIPALSLPVRGKGKMPIGLQLMAPHFHERQLLDVAEYVERANAVA